MQVAIAWSQWSERKAQLADLTIQQAQLLAGNLDGIAQGARILLGAATESQEVQRLEPGCDRQLARLRRHAPGYAFIALVDPAGRIACASDPNLAAHGRRGRLGRRRPRRHRLRRRPLYPHQRQPGRASCPSTCRITADTPAGGGTLVAALELGWLEQALQRHEAGPARPSSPPAS